MFNKLRFIKMTGFFVWFILYLRAVHAVSECTQTFLFDKIFVDSKLISNLETSTLDSRLLCSKKCQDNKYCTGFSYNLSSGRCEIYDKIMANATIQSAYGTMTYKANAVCGPPPSISNTTSEPSDQDYVPGHLMLYDCIPDTYQNTSIVCLNDGIWNTSAVGCHHVCGPPPSIPNTNTQPADQDYRPGHLMLYDCIPNTYQNTSIVCLEGTWNTSAVSCQYDCGLPPSIPNTNTQPADQDYRPGYLMLYDCISGTYQNTSIFCLSNGIWNTSAVGCQNVKTCDEAASLGVNVGSDLEVKPIASSSSVIVKCEYDGGNYWTVIDTTWDNTSTLQGHYSARGGVYDVSYSIGLNYISVIADSSTFCTQYMKVICRHSSLMEYNGWRIRDGSLADYFYGGIKGQMNCACDLNNSCYNNLTCNCNANDYAERQDEGFSTYKDDLPVTAFLNGDTDRSDEYYIVHISSLRCKGFHH